MRACDVRDDVCMWIVDIAQQFAFIMQRPAVYKVKHWGPTNSMWFEDPCHYIGAPLQGP